MRALKFFAALIIITALACKSSSDDSKRIAVAYNHTSDFEFNEIPASKAEMYKQELEAYYNRMYVAHGFNGAMLIAKNGVILFEDYRGVISPKTKEPITAETPFHIASTSKTFTGTAILRLWEQGKLSLDDSIQQYYPAFPYHGITIRLLLAHRSGLPNYLYFMDKVGTWKTRFTNHDVINYMITNKPPVAAYPNRVFQYCNTNYILLAGIIEMLTKQSYPDYMRDSVFNPLGMYHTKVFSLKDTNNYVPTYAANWRPYPMDKMDCTYGDKNIYSTVRDLLQWDIALYKERFVKKSTLDSAFIPTSHERKSMHNYGLGWRLLIKEQDTVVYHNGKWHGTNSAFTRFIKDTATIIVIGNKYNGLIYRSKDMASVITGKQDSDNLSE